MKPAELHCTTFVGAVRNFLMKEQDKGHDLVPYLSKLAAMEFPVAKIIKAE